MSAGKPGRPAKGDPHLGGKAPRGEKPACSGEFGQPVQEGGLSGVDLRARFREGEPLGAVDLREILHAPGAGRPFHLKGVAARRAGEVALASPGVNGLAALLQDGAERGGRARAGADSRALPRIRSGRGPAGLPRRARARPSGCSAFGVFLLEKRAGGVDSSTSMMPPCFRQRRRPALVFPAGMVGLTENFNGDKEQVSSRVYPRRAHHARLHASVESARRLIPDQLRLDLWRHDGVARRWRPSGLRPSPDPAPPRHPRRAAGHADHLRKLRCWRSPDPKPACGRWRTHGRAAMARRPSRPPRH